MDKKKILDDLQVARVQKTDALVGPVLITMMEQDLAVFDVEYIERRLVEILEKTIHLQDFDYPELQALRKEYLTKQLELVIKGLPEPKQFKKKTKDLTEIREQKAEPVVYKILSLLLDSSLVLSDTDYINEALKEQSSDMFKLLSMGYSSKLFSRIEFHLAESMKRANAILWNNKSREQITFKDVDNILKGEKQIPNEK